MASVLCYHSLADPRTESSLTEGKGERRATALAVKETTQVTDTIEPTLYEPNGETFNRLTPSRLIEKELDLPSHLIKIL